MKRVSRIFLCFVFVYFLIASFELAKSEEVGYSNKIHLYLNQVTFKGVIVEGGAWGDFKYSIEDGGFVFNGHGLMPNLNYALIWFTNPSPDSTFICLGNAVTTAGGNIHIQGARKSLTDASSPYLSIWLVLSEDVTCDNSLHNWNLSYYLVPSSPPTFEPVVVDYDWYLQKRGVPPLAKVQIDPEFYREFLRGMRCTNCDALKELAQQAKEEHESVMKQQRCTACQIEHLKEIIYHMACLQRCFLEPDSTCECLPPDSNRCDGVCDFLN